MPFSCGCQTYWSAWNETVVRLDDEGLEDMKVLLIRQFGGASSLHTVNYQEDKRLVS